jgi:hypothetical protein
MKWPLNNKCSGIIVKNHTLDFSFFIILIFIFIGLTVLVLIVGFIRKLYPKLKRKKQNL